MKERVSRRAGCTHGMLSREGCVGLFLGVSLCAKITIGALGQLLSQPLLSWKDIACTPGTPCLFMPGELLHGARELLFLFDWGRLLAYASMPCTRKTACFFQIGIMPNDSCSSRVISRLWIQQPLRAYRFLRPLETLTAVCQVYIFVIPALMANSKSAQTQGLHRWDNSLVSASHSLPK